jgi:membrane protein
MSAMGETVRRARRADVPFAAASVAYYLLLSIFPILVLAFAAVQIAYGNALGEWVVGQLAPALTPRGRDLIRNVLADSTGALAISLAGLFALVWAWNRLYCALERCFERVYEGQHTIGRAGRVLGAAIVVPAICIGLALTAGGIVTNGPGVTWQVIQVVGIALALFPVFVTLPPNRPRLAAAAFGAAVTAGIWTALRLAFDIYATVGTYSIAYGFLGASILSIAFLYLGTVSLLLSVSLTATLNE